MSRKSKRKTLKRRMEGALISLNIGKRLRRVLASIPRARHIIAPKMEDIEPGVDRLKSNGPSFTTLKTRLDSDGYGIPISNDGAKALAPFIAKSRTLKKILIDNASIRTEGILVLIDALRDHSSIETIKLDYNVVGDEGAEALSKILKSKHSRIKELHLCGCRIGAAGLKSLVEACRCNVGSLEKLYLSSNQFTGKDVCQTFESCTPQDIKLNELDFSLNWIGSRGAIVVANLLCRNKTVEVLSLVNCGIDSSVGNAFGELLRINLTLKDLSLYGNQIGEGGFGGTIEGLRHNTSLVSLNMGSTGICDATVEALVGVLKRNHALKSLKLSSNEIHNAGARFLAELVSVNQTIENLDLKLCEIGDEGLVALARGLRRNTAITGIILGGNEYGLKGVQSICGVLEQSNQTLKRLGLILDNAGIDGVHAVANVLRHNKSLEILDISDSEITTEGAKVLSLGLRHNRRLKQLFLSDNRFGNDGLSVIVNNALREHNFVLEEIDASDCYIDDRELTKEMDLYLRWNKAGRRLLRERVPNALWHAVLAKSSQDAEVLYCFIREKSDDLMAFLRGT